MFNAEQTTLDQIKTKIRRITKSPNNNQLTDQQIVDYVNWYYVYDFPEELRLKSLKSNYTFFTVPNQDVYDLPVNQYVSVEPPLYIAGFESYYSQNQAEFYRKYNKAAVINNNVATGNGTVGLYQFTALNVPLLKSCVTVSTTDAAGNGISLIDDGQGNFIEAGQTKVNISLTQTINPVQVTAAGHRLTTGQSVTISGVNGMTELNGNTYLVTVLDGNNFTLDGIDGTGFTPYTSGGIVSAGSQSFGTVNYITGAIDVTFRVAIPNGNGIDFTGVPYVASRPTACLFYDNQFILRPVPDRAYKVEIAAFFNPTNLLNETNNPILNEWWEIIALGASLKIFTDRRELRVRDEYKPIYDEQLRQSLRRTLVQQRNQRAATIYTDQVDQYGSNFSRNNY